MFVKRISVSNFKSFRSLDIELNSFNVLVGANSSGKSNFLEIFRFLRDIATHGLNNAISLQGGVEYLRNTNIGTSAELTVKVVYRPNIGTFRKMGQQGDVEQGIEMRSQELIHDFALSFAEKGYRISRDRLIRKVAFFEIETKDEEIVQEKKVGEEEVSIFRVGDKFEYALSDESLSEWIGKPHSLLFEPNFQQFLRPDLLLLEPGVINFGTLPGYRLTDISIYDFAPKTSKKAVPITGKMDLEEDGSNLPVVLKNILENEYKRRKFLNLSKYLLDFVDDVQVEDVAGKFLFLTFKEHLSPSIYLPANLMSEGTISLLSLLVATYFQEKPLIMIEEPERNIHPFLIAKVVDMLKEVSENKQIVITTHNPEIVKQVDLANILLLSKDKEGFSTISRPSENTEVKIFLENEIGIGDLYIQNLLGV